MRKIMNLFAAAAVVLISAAGCGEKEKPGNTGGGNGGGAIGKTPTADFTFTQNGLEIQFTNTSSDATAYLWNFGDGITSTEVSPVHTYSAAGEYTVSLTAQNDDGAISKKEQFLTVAGSVKAYWSFTARTDRAGKFGKIIDFDAQASANAAGISWDFGDGSEVTSTGTDFKLSHEFPGYGKYTVKAIVTGISGDTDEYSADVEVIAYNELLKGGSMEEDDAKYWTVKEYWATSGYEPAEGTPAFVHEFGHKSSGPAGGKGGCLRLGGENQIEDGSYTATIYQAIEVVEGDQIEISAQVKWGEDTMDDGLFWICIADDPATDFEPDGTPKADDANIFVSLMNWWNPGNPVPAFDGNLAGNDVFNNESDYGFSSPGTPAIYTAPVTGTVYLMIELRSVWGTCFGAGKDYFIDEVSAKILM